MAGDLGSLGEGGLGLFWLGLGDGLGDGFLGLGGGFGDWVV